MFTMKTRDLVKSAIKSELENAKKVYGEKYNSIHEGYAVTAEEVDEVTDMAKGVKFGLEDLWKAVKNNEEIGEQLGKIYYSAFYCALECIQVCACIDKITGKTELEVE